MGLILSSTCFFSGRSRASRPPGSSRNLGEFSLSHVVLKGTNRLKGWEHRVTPETPSLRNKTQKKVILNPPVPLPPQKCSCLYFHLLNFFLCFFFPTHFHVGRESPLPAPAHQYHSSEKRVGFLYSCNISRFLNLQKAKFSSSGSVLQYLRIKLPSA